MPRRAGRADATLGAVARLANLLQDLRQSRGLKQGELAAALRVQPSTLSEVERGRRVPSEGLCLAYEEFFVLPSGSLVRLRERAQNEEQLLLLLSGRARDTNPGSPELPGNLFVGRENDMSVALITLQGSHVLHVTGPPGVGKTRFGLEVAHRLEEAALVDEGAWIRFPETANAAVSPLSRVARLLVPDLLLELPTDTLAQLLQDRWWAVVLDDVDFALGDLAPVLDLIDAVPSCKWIITSRERLSAREASRVVALKPLDLLPEETINTTPERWRALPAVELFLDRAGYLSSVRSAEIAPDVLRGVARICCGVGGLPLALELAAARASILPLESIDELLDADALPDTPEPRVPARHRSLTDTIAWTYRALDGRLQAFLRNMAVFRGSTSFDAVVSVVAGGSVSGTAQHLTRLADLSLLEVEANEISPRVRLLPPIRAFLLGQFDLPGAIRDRHADWYTSILHEAATWYGAEQASYFTSLEGDQDNIRAALEWLHEGRQSAYVDVVLKAWRFWQVTGRYDEATVWLDKALALASSSEETCRVTVALGQINADRGFVDRALDYATVARDTAEQLDNPSLRIHPLVLFARCKFLKGQLKEALDVLEDALATTRLAECSADHDHDHEQHRSHVLLELASVEERLGSDSRANTYAEEGLAIARSRKDLRAIAAGLNLFASAALGREDYTEAGRLWDEAETHLRQIGDRLGLSTVLGNRAVLYRRRGETEDAVRLLEESIQVSREIGDVSGVAYGALNLGKIDLAEERLNSAMNNLARACELAEAMPDSYCAFEAALALSEAEERRGNGDAAVNYAQRARDKIGRAHV